MIMWENNYHPQMYAGPYAEVPYDFPVNVNSIMKPLNPSKLPGSYSCPNCGKTYRYLRNMQNHLKIECGQEPKIKCPHCPYKTKYKSSLQKHIERKHMHFRKRN